METRSAIMATTERLGKTEFRSQKHPDLMVRGSGYSAYFADLTREVQDEIIGRTEHCSA